MSKFAVLTSLSLLSGSAVASIITPNCLLSWSWSFNSLGQNACTVAAYLLSTCNAGSYTITSLASGHSYPGPSGVDDTNLCKCGTVVYNLMSACDGCQNGTWITWSQYSLNCTKTLPPSTFPNLVPAGTRVPQWALLDPTPQNNWSNITAFAAGDSPELAPGAMLGPSNTPTSHSSGSSASPLPSTSTSLVKGSKSNAGAVAGGIIGGVAAMTIVIFTIFYFMRRKRRSRAPSAGFIIDDAPPPLPVDYKPQQSLPAGPPYMPTPTPGPSSPTTMRPRASDPNDPIMHRYQGTATTQNALALSPVGNDLTSMPMSPPPEYASQA